MNSPKQNTVYSSVNKRNLKYGKAISKSHIMDSVRRAITAAELNASERKESRRLNISRRKRSGSRVVLRCVGTDLASP